MFAAIQKTACSRQTPLDCLAAIEHNSKEIIMLKQRLKLEKVESGRWLVRTHTGVRKGEVFGHSGHYQAQTMRGTFVGNHKTIQGAADLLLEGASDASS